MNLVFYISSTCSLSLSLSQVRSTSPANPDHYVLVFPFTKTVSWFITCGMPSWNCRVLECLYPRMRFALVLMNSHTHAYIHKYMYVYIYLFIYRTGRIAGPFLITTTAKYFKVFFYRTLPGGGVYVYIHIYVCMYMYICIHLYLCVYIYICICVCVCACPCF